MGFENVQQITSETKKEKALDEEWYERFEKIGAFQDFEYLEGEKKQREEQKRLFLEESVRNPDLGYPKLEKFNFEKTENELLELKNDILALENNEVVRKAYHWKINEKIAQVRMLRAVREGRDDKVLKYSTFVYGFPDKDVFAYDLKAVSEIIAQNEGSDDLRKLFAMRRLRESLELESANENGISGDFLPVKKRVLLYPFQEEKKFKATEIKEEFESALDEMKIEGWSVVIDENITAISVSQEKKIVKVPEKRKLNEIGIKKLIAHEIETHVLRREKGENSKLKLMGLGLDRYLSGEEGISTFAEQEIEGTDEFAGFDGHLAVSLAVGLDGKKRDFREVFNILSDYMFLKSKEKDLNKAWENAKTAAWNRCVRTFRGTSCNTPGACLTRDIVYREGNINTWIVARGNLEEVTKFSLGKYDAFNPRHAWILEQLGISDNDLETLDK